MLSGPPPEDEDAKIHERYTVPYIEREAHIILRFCRNKQYRGMGPPIDPLTSLDRRILERWGLG
jgi:hypothetical protein